MKVGLFCTVAGALCFAVVIATAQWLGKIMHLDGYVSSSMRHVSGDERGQMQPGAKASPSVFTGVDPFTSFHPGNAASKAHMSIGLVGGNCASQA